MEAFETLTSASLLARSQSSLWRSCIRACAGPKVRFISATSAASCSAMCPTIVLRFDEETSQDAVSCSPAWNSSNGNTRDRKAASSPASIAAAA